MKYLMAFLISTTMIFSLANAGYAQSSQGKNHGLKFQVEKLETEVTALQNQVNTLQTELKSVIALAPYVSVDQEAENGLAGPNIVFKGANVHIESGSGATVDSSGLGNLVIGYDEDNGNSSIDDARTGSNNVIIGPGHEFTASGALMAGYQNVSTSNYTVAEGTCDVAGASASTSCGSTRPSLADGEAASVSGGVYNTASSPFSSVSGGQGNVASGIVSSVSGGGYNRASGQYSSVGGGHQNQARGWLSGISGGDGNIASGNYSSVSGGQNNYAGGDYSSVSGGAVNTAYGNYSSVSGGQINRAGVDSAPMSGEYSVVSGGSGNAATGDWSSIGGGQNKSATTNYQNVN